MVGGDDVVILAVKKQNGGFLASGGVEVFLVHGAARMADEGGNWLGKAWHGIEAKHGALRKAKESHIGERDVVVLAEVGEIGPELIFGYFYAGAVAEGPIGIGEPLAALADGCWGGGVGEEQGQTFTQLTAGGLEGGGEGEKVVAIGTETV